MALQPFVRPWPLFSSFIFYTVGRTSWTGDQPVARPLPGHGTAQTQNKRTQTSIPQVGFETTIPLMIIIFWEMTPCGSYKKMIIIVTAVETSNLTHYPIV
jgi:hypothetical protein